MEVAHEATDRVEDMEGWIPDKGKWTKIFNAQLAMPAEPEIGNYDDIVRHLITGTDEDYGWVIKSEGLWRQEPLTNLRMALGSIGLNSKDTTNILGSSVFKCWKIVNRPFQSEYPGDRTWNRNAAQYRFIPTRDSENLKYPT